MESKDLDVKLDEIYRDVMIPQSRYLITFEDDMKEAIVLNIDENINRPNNPDDDEIIAEYVEYNYGGTGYEAIRIDDLKSFRIK